MVRLNAAQRKALGQSGCHIRFDELTRSLYATDASIYRVEPRAVAFPSSAADAAMVIKVAAELDIPITPRGAGTGLTGAAIGDGLVVDLARHNRSIREFDRDRQTVRVSAGVVLDQLNAFLRPHGFWFGPDVATSSRATIGGMIGNNSSGAYAPIYGTTVDHIESLEVVLPDGSVADVGRASAELPELRKAADELIARHSAVIRERLPDVLVKRWPGYGFDHALRSPGDLSRLVCGSEGTLAAVSSAVLRVVPLPAQRGLAVLFFEEIVDAMQAAVELLALEPAAVEHVDRILFDQTRGQLPFAEARSLLDLDDESCNALLLVEFFDDFDDKLSMIAERGIGLRQLICSNAREQALVWEVRRAGLSLLTGCKGPAKPTACIEDVCVRPEQLPAYVADLSALLSRRGLRASFYGHAASGELHIRPALDLHRSQDLAKLRQLSDEVSDLCLRYRASIAAEHGVGIARTEYLADHVGPELAAATRQIKRLFDPTGVMNPGKIVDNGRFRIDDDLRLGEGSELRLPFTELLGFVDRDESFVGNLEQCNGCGGCRKESPTMCPTFIATGEEIQSTRGRANTILAVLEGRLGDRGIYSPELEQALGDCLSCKACRTECPSNVDLALLKAELLHARSQTRGVAVRDRVIAAADTIGRLGTAAPRLANRVLRSRIAARVAQLLLGFAPDRLIPPFAPQRFDRWFAARPEARDHDRGRVILWDDTWVRYHEPQVGRAAVDVLEAAGFEVSLAVGRRCCGRPAASRGLLDEARRLGEHNLALLSADASSDPILFLEASCHSMFVDEYRQLGIPGAHEVAERCVLFEDFLHELVTKAPEALHFVSRDLPVAIHSHCHAKALCDPSRLPSLVERIPGTRAELLDTGCCGMAGAFGMLQEKQELSRSVAAPLVALIEALTDETRLVASGTSCRHQIQHLTKARPLHLAELLAESLDNRRGSKH